VKQEPDLTSCVFGAPRGETDLAAPAPGQACSALRLCLGHHPCNMQAVGCQCSYWQTVCYTLQERINEASLVSPPAPAAPVQRLPVPVPVPRPGGPTGSAESNKARQQQEQAIMVALMRPEMICLGYRALLYPARRP